MSIYQGKKLKEYLKNKGISMVDAAKRLNVSRQNVYQYCNSNNLERETVNRILTEFNISEEEMFGERSLGATGGSFTKSTKVNDTKDVDEVYPAYVSNAMNKHVLKYATPMWDQDFSGESSLSKIMEDQNSEYVPSALFLQSDFKGCDLIIKHTDKGMAGLFESNEWLGIKKVDKKKIIPGKMYVVVLEGNYGAVLERYLFYNRQTNKYRLRPHNTEVEEEFEVDESEVMETWIIKAHAPELKISRVT